MKPTKHVIPVISTVTGYIKGINISKIRETAIYINAIRVRESDNLDIGAGIEFARKVGDKVRQGEILGYIHTNDDTRIHRGVQNLLESFEMSERLQKQNLELSKL